MAEKVLFKPKELYDKVLSKSYHDAAEEYFKRLKDFSKVDEAANRVHVDDFNKKKAAADKQAERLGASRAKMITSLVFGVLFAVAGLVSLIFAFVRGFNWIALLVGLLLALAACLLFVLCGRFHKKSKAQAATLERMREVEKQALQLCYDDMAVLNSLFDESIPMSVMEKATPIIDLDPVFTPERLMNLVENYGYEEKLGDERSALGVLSGRIQGNPFMLLRLLEREVKMKTYTGSIVIHWVTYTRDSNGRSRAVNHTQTLTATTQHEAPFFATDTYMVYANDAAPRLHFTRSPSNAHTLTPDQRRKESDKATKELAKKAEKSIATDRPFTPLANSEFEHFFGALDRDNEVEFRLLFTPLAQQNILDLIEDPKPYGDDFSMIKSGRINVVRSAHSQNFNYSSSPSLFQGYDLKAVHANFVSYCDSFIQSLFFDLAPLLSIPLYQMHKSRDYIYKGNYERNVTAYEQECLVNGMDKHNFIPDGANANLPLILKVTANKKFGRSDSTEVVASSYVTTDMVDYVPVMGGDGRTHSVPVPWIKYDEVSKSTPIQFRPVGGTRYDFFNAMSAYKGLGDFTSGLARYERGLLAKCNGGLCDGEEAPLDKAGEADFRKTLFDKASEKATGK